MWPVCNQWTERGKVQVFFSSNSGTRARPFKSIPPLFSFLYCPPKQEEIRYGNSCDTVHCFRLLMREWIKFSCLHTNLIPCNIREGWLEKINYFSINYYLKKKLINLKMNPYWKRVNNRTKKQVFHKIENIIFKKYFTIVLEYFLKIYQTFSYIYRHHWSGKELWRILQKIAKIFREKSFFKANKLYTTFYNY